MPVNPVDVELMWRTNKKTSAPTRALELKLEIMTDRPTDRPTNRQTDIRGHREVPLLIIFGIVSFFPTAT